MVHTARNIFRSVSNVEIANKEVKNKLLIISTFAW